MPQEVTAIRDHRLEQLAQPVIDADTELHDARNGKLHDVRRGATKALALAASLPVGEPDRPLGGVRRGSQCG